MLTSPASLASSSWKAQPAAPVPTQPGTVKVPLSSTSWLAPMTPSWRAAVAVISLKVEPGVYWPEMA